MTKVVSISRTRPLLLVADDDRGTRLILQHVFENGGFDVETACDGAEAIDKFMDLKPDGLLLDVQMPFMDGFSVCEYIRAREDSVRTPIVMITGQNDSESVAKAYQIGATDFIAKPFDNNTLPFRLHHLLRASSEHNSLQSLINGIPDAIAVLNPVGKVIEFLNADNLFTGVDNDTMAEMVDSGHRLSDELMDKIRINVAKVLNGDVIQEFEFQVENSDRHFETRMIRRDQSSVLAVIRDVTSRLEAEQKIHELAYFDNLTGLPNREQFKQKLNQAIARAGRRGSQFALMYLDLDRFKRINDTFGHSVGDTLLRAVASRLRKCIRGGSGRDEGGSGSAEVCRIGGDEFTILLPDLPRASVVEDICQRIRESLTAPFSCQGHQFVISPSIGIAIYPLHGKDEQQLLMNADTAMYQAKEEGCNTFRVYDASMNARSLEYMELESDLNNALQCNELELHYQPKIDMRSWTVIGVEALLRWRHPDRGWISPADFIPLAEETGQIIELGRWVVAQACRQLKAWQDTPLRDLQVAVNISSLQFTHDDLLQSVMQSMWKNSVRPWKLELEITESVLLGNVEGTIELLNAFKEAGISVAIDDFGTGYSSLSYLKRFPLDKLKIDQSFIRDLHTNADDAAICSAILAMGRQLGLTVVAEGVENAAQLGFLNERHCDQIQGFYFSKALSPAELPDFMEEELQPRLQQLRLDRGALV
ncbi:MAG: EAL domain-containing protein [Halieaceae bacterium]